MLVKAKKDLHFFWRMGHRRWAQTAQRARALDPGFFHFLGPEGPEGPRGPRTLGPRFGSKGLVVFTEAFTRSYTSSTTNFNEGLVSAKAPHKSSQIQWFSALTIF